MLSSSDAKWRCMWHMLIWSILLTLVSQFLRLTQHIAFLLFAAVSVLILPVLTSTYSNTAGKNGAGMLRVGYVICDPVLACLSVTPVLLLKQLPGVVRQYDCLSKLRHDVNATTMCLRNTTEKRDIGVGLQHYDYWVNPTYDMEALFREKKYAFLIIQGAVIAPIMLALMMGRRTHKMTFNTYTITLVYWLVAAVEATDLLENALLGDAYRHMIYTTEAIISIVMIISNSYAIVTLCSYVTPARRANEPRDGADSCHQEDKFDLLYKGLTGAAGLMFIEIPLVVVRLQIWATPSTGFLPGVFYVWLMKDIVFIGLIITSAFVQTFGQRLMRIPCKPSIDAGDVFFQPEKRDAYIVHRRQRAQMRCAQRAAAALRTIPEVNETGDASDASTTVDETRDFRKTMADIRVHATSNDPHVKLSKRVSFSTDLIKVAPISTFASRFDRKDT